MHLLAIFLFVFYLTFYMYDEEDVIVCCYVVEEKVESVTPSQVQYYA